MEEDNSAIAIDNGSYSFSIGFVGEERPDHFFRSGLDKSDSLVELGNSNIDHPDELSSCIRTGIVTDWEKMERMWENAIEIVNPSLKEKNYFMNEPYNLSIDQIVKKHELFFEKFNAFGFFSDVAPLMTLYSSGRTTGIIISIGHERMEVIPVHEGFLNSESLTRDCIISNYGVGHKTITNEIFERYNKKSGHTKISFETARKIKEQHGKIRIFEDNNNNKPKKIFKLPSGDEIKISEELICSSTDILFDPKRITESSYTDNFFCKDGNRNSSFPFHSPGILEMFGYSVNQLFKSKNLEGKDKRIFLRNVVFDIGHQNFNPIFPGIQTRMKNEWERRLENMEWKKKSVFSDPKNYSFSSSSGTLDQSSWVGLSIIGSLSCHNNQNIFRYEYDETGTEGMMKRLGKFYGNESIRAMYGIREPILKIWSFYNHGTFSKGFREVITCLMLCIHKRGSNVYVIPKEVLYIIISFLPDGENLDVLMGCRKTAHEIQNLCWDL